MNDTILNSRQKQILELINRSQRLSRLEVKEKLPSQLSASIPTIARDLRFLHQSGFVVVFGKGRGTGYLAKNTNVLLKYFDIDRYFTLEADQRTDARKSFNFEIFSHLNTLFSESEIIRLNKSNKKFSEGTRLLNKDIYARELERFVIELSWKSSKIEGNTYSLLDTETLIKEQLEAKGHPKDEAIMILNHKRAFESILASPTDYRVLSLSHITQLHNIITAGLNVSTGIRKQAVGVTGTIYRPLDNEWQIKESIDTFIAVVNQTAYPLEKALVIIAMISYIQPFADGNKRTGRMLANAVLLAHDFYPLSYRSVAETDYKKALILFYEQNSLYYLKEILIDQYTFALETYF